MAKIQIKSEKLTPFGGFFSIMEQFDSTLSSVIDSTLGPRDRSFYKAIIQRLDVKRFGLNATSRIKAFVFKFITVPDKWIGTPRQSILNIYPKSVIRPQCSKNLAIVLFPNIFYFLVGFQLRIASSRLVGQGNGNIAKQRTEK